MSNEIIYKCPNCGNVLKYSATTHKFGCDSCSAEFNTQEMELLNKFSDLKNETTVDMNFSKQFRDFDSNEIQIFHCNSCGAELTTTPDTSATICAYCQSPVILTQKVSGVLKPNVIIPFAIDERTAKEKFKSWCKRGLFFETEFKNQDRIESMKGTYIPFWLFDTVSNVTLSCIGVKTNSYTSGDYRVTQHHYYRVIREGYASFDKVPVDASEKMDDQLMETIEPYKYQDLIPFSTPYLSGFFADKYNYTSEQLKRRIIDKIQNFSKDFFKSTIVGYSYLENENIHFMHKDKKVEYALLPVWQINYNFRGKTYSFVVNGQTGEVAGKAPMSVTKMLLYFLLVFVISFILITIGGVFFV